MRKNIHPKYSLLISLSLTDFCINHKQISLFVDEHIAWKQIPIYSHAFRQLHIPLHIFHKVAGADVQSLRFFDFPLLAFRRIPVELIQISHNPSFFFCFASQRYDFFLNRRAFTPFFPFTGSKRKAGRGRNETKTPARWSPLVRR